MEDNHFIDTNVIIRFLLFDEVNPKLSHAAKNIFTSATKGKYKLFISDIVISEVCYVLEGAYKIRKHDIVEYLKDLLSLKNIFVNNKNIIFTCLDIYAESNCDFEDAHIYTTMLAAGSSKIFTFDTKHFKRFKGIDVLP